MKLKRLLATFMSVIFLPFLAMANEHAPLQHAEINLKDKASLQRGAALFMNYCSGCHSLKYMRYKRVAKDIGIVNDKGEVDEALVKKDLIFGNDKIHDVIQTAMPAEKAPEWFGVLPPDLTLVARVRGADWLFSYLVSFYKDSKRPFGVNNLVFPDVAMPNVLSTLQGEQVGHVMMHTIVQEGVEKQEPYVDSLELVKSGKMDTLQFRGAMTDLVNFLVYIAEPAKLDREALGWKVLLFLIIFIVIAYLLKREYWRDVH